jgi:hypothetical protein
VKGFGIDWEKIKALLKTTDDKDHRIDGVMQRVMLSVDREEHWICGAYPLDGPRKLTNVISFGKESFGDDLEGLQQREIPIPRYMLKMEAVLTGPKVFLFKEW